MPLVYAPLTAHVNCQLSLLDGAGYLGDMNATTRPQAPAKEIGQRIAEARKRRGLSGEQLGEALGTTKQSVGHWESA